jgi:hypothetical protein
MSEPPRPPLDETQPIPPPPLPPPAPGTTSQAAPAFYRRAPLPVQPLIYSTPHSAGRPGVLTAVGVISIVVAGLSALSSLSTGMQALTFAVLMPKMASMATTPRVATPPPTVMTTTTAGPGGSVVNSSTITIHQWGGAPATGPSTAPATAPATLTPSEIQSIVQRVQQMSGNGLSPAQVSTLQSALQTNSPPLVSPAYAFSPILTVDKSPDGSVDIQFNGGGALSLNSGGQVVSQSAAGTAIVPTLPRIGIGVGVLLGVDALASLALAVLLLVAGIQVFRNSPGAARLHRIFAVLKIPVGVFGAAAVALMYGQMLGSMGGGAFRGPGGTRMVEIGYFTGYFVLSCAYPIALLIVLRTRGVRAYYQSVRG